MADADTRLPVRALATDVTVEVADSTGTTIDPAAGFAQGSTTSGQKGPLAQGAVTTANPAYTTGQTSPLSLDVNGNLRVLTTPAGGDQPVNVDKWGGVATTLGQKVMASSVPVVIASDQSDVPTNIDKFGGTAVTLGQKVMASSIPVVLASDQSAIPVTISGDTEPQLFNYNTAAAVAANATSTHSFTPGSTISFDGITVASSGQAKWELQYGTTGSETTKVVMFTSKGDLTAHFRIPGVVSITSAMTIKIIRTNMDNQALDLYSTVVYH